MSSFSELVFYTIRGCNNKMIPATSQGLHPYIRMTDQPNNSQAIKYKPAGVAIKTKVILIRLGIVVRGIIGSIFTVVKIGFV